MNRTLLALVMLNMLAMTAGAQQTLADKIEPNSHTLNTGSSSSSTASPELRTWSIPNVEETIKKNKENTFERVAELYYLVLSRSSGGGCVAIVAFEPGRRESFILNPSGAVDARFRYGPVPNLHYITPAQADQLWGTGSEEDNTSDERTYKLIGTDKNAYFLDLVFSKDDHRLERYSLRGPGFWGYGRKLTKWSILNPPIQPEVDLPDNE